MNTENYASDVHKIKESDWVITNYHLFSSLDRQALSKLYRLGFNHIVLDEIHNAKNPEAIRTQAVQRLALDLDHLTLLSGTPVPNSIEDAYMLMHLLDPKTYPISSDNNLNSATRFWFKKLYWQNPQAFKELMHRKMIRRTARDYISAKLPEVEEKDIFIDIAGRCLEIYDSLLEQKLPLGRKLMQLEKAMLDSQLVHQSLIPRGKIITPKYDALDDIIAKEVRGGKILVFTSLKEDVIDSLVNRYNEYGAIAITGDIPASDTSKRERLRKQFQYDPKTRVLIATTVMHEGVDLTAATSIVNLMLPWTPAEYQQRQKRSDRWGEIEKEHLVVYNILGRYPRRVRNSLDEARQKMLQGKQKVVDYLFSGLQLTREQLTDFQNPLYVPGIKRAMMSNNQIVFKYFLNWRGIGTQGALRRLKRSPKANEETAEMYVNFSMARNSAQLYLPIIQELTPKEPWLDLAGGPGMLGYYAEKPVHVLDISYNYLKEGQKLKIGHHVQGSFSAIPYSDDSFGLLVCSLAFQMSEPNQERAQVLQEINRVLKSDGIGIVTLPTNYLTSQDRHKFGSRLKTYGFDLLKQYHGIDMGPSKLELYVLRKTGNSDSKLHDLTFEGDRMVRR